MPAFTVTYLVIGAATTITIDADPFGPPIFARGTSPTGAGGTQLDVGGTYHYFAPNDSSHHPNVTFFSEWRVAVDVPIITDSECLEFTNPSLHLCPPTANDQSVSTTQNIPLSITLTGSDPHGESLTYATNDPPTHGVLTGSAPNLTYTPAADYIGPDSFTFHVTNTDSLSSQLATVTIDVQPPPPPTQLIVTPSSGTILGDTFITIYGMDFVATPEVTIGGLPCTEVAFVSSSAITCRTPAGAAAGAAAVVVTNPDDQTCTAPLDFNYLPAISGSWGLHSFEMKSRPEQTS